MSASLEVLEEAFAQRANPLSYIPLADEYRRRGRYDDALEVCAKGIEKAGESVRGLTVLGRIHYDMGHFEEATSILKRAIAQAPGSFEPTLLLAKSLARERDFVEARHYLEPLLMTYPRTPELQLLNRVVLAEISQSITELTEISLSNQELDATRHALRLRHELEDIPGVDAVFEFGLVQEDGEIYFEDIEGQELDDDIKITLIECARLTLRLNFGPPRQAILETDYGRIFFRMRGRKGLMALARPIVKLGRLRFLMDQYLQALGRVTEL